MAFVARGVTIIVRQMIGGGVSIGLGVCTGELVGVSGGHGAADRCVGESGG